MTFTSRRSPSRVPRGIAAATVLFACGSRTGIDASELSSDAGPLADAAPCCDGSLPGDASTARDAGGCANGGGAVEVSYVFDAVGVLYRYDPRTARPTRLGAPNCGNGNVPWTMTASREHAYVVYTDWTLYAVDLVTLACSPTSFRSGQLGLDSEFGVAVSGSGATERLFVYGQPTGGTSPILAVTDLSSFVLTKVGDVRPAPPVSSFPVNLTADATGHLIAFSPGLRRLHERHWGAALFLALAVVVFGVLLVRSFEWAGRQLGPHVEQLEQRGPR